MAGRLAGKVAIVTGGASGIGLATVERFIEEDAQVVFCDLPPAAPPELRSTLGAQARFHRLDRSAGGTHDGHEIARRLGPSAHFVPCDVTERLQLAAVVQAAVERFGGLDILFNNAGIAAAEGPIATAAEDAWDRTMAINVKAAFVGIRLAAPEMAKRGGGAIVNTASISGLSGSAGQPAYAASKAAIMGLTREAAVELAPQRVRVNAVCPGLIVTPILYDAPSFRPIDPDLVRVHASRVQPIPRAGEARDVANLVLFLASDDASFITGESITIDGGLMAEMDPRARTSPDDAITGFFDRIAREGG
jgi:NAD(P)-dependent dehydrogenase (short-subunit alcohol dehydrogenase family)